MKNLLFSYFFSPLCWLCVLLTVWNPRVLSQNSATPITIHSIQSINNQVSIVLHSSQHYHVGANRHALKIGNQSFYNSLQSYIDDIKVLTFTLPVSEFNQLQNNASVTLCYGDCADSARHWDLGTLNKDQLASKEEQ